jgi:hypothetical protein
MPEPMKLPPKASRTIEGLRDTGYEPSDALEDIIDNSIAANASKIVVRVFSQPGGEIVVTVADNGIGMDEDGLINAMTYGSQVRSDPKSLGKFGLGLKTASTAMCRKFTVVTRPGEDQPVHAATWDLDYVRDNDEWLLLRPDPTDEQGDLMDEAADGGSGTIVIWEKVDRLLSRDYVDPEGTLARRALRRRIDGLRESIAVTYLKFLERDSDRDEVTIYLNDEPVEPWDPFGAELGSDLLFDKSVPVDITSATGTQSTAEFHLKAYSLPPRADLTKEQEEQAKIATSNQGFFVFRENRLLASGTWLGLRSVEPHLNLARIEFSFDHRLDDAFQIDIKKSRILLQSDLQDALKTLVAPWIREAENRYRKNQKTVATAGAPNTHSGSNNTIKKNIDTLQRTNIEIEDGNVAKISNSRGTTRIQIKLPLGPTGPHVSVSDSLDDGMLWEPTVIEMKQAALINAGHPFYERVYMPNHDNGTATQGLDFLIWALCQAEWAVVTDDEIEAMKAIRREVSRVTRQLSLELPEFEANS